MLTNRLEYALQALFHPADAAVAASLVNEHFSVENSHIPPEALERIAAAVLKKSDGSLDGLQAEIDLARRDWRDLLMAAGFGHDLAAHELWLGSLSDRRARGQ